MSEHTPGPWEWNHVPSVFIKNDDGEELELAHVDPNNDIWLEVAFANARLMAQSPIMYEYIAKKASEGDLDAQAILSKINA